MRRVIVAANWKMNTTPADAGDLARTIASRTRVDGVVRIICPPFVCLAAVDRAVAGAASQASDGSPVWVGAQNVHQDAAGAHTGEISASMLAGLASWVIVGHSERRRDAGETDAQIAAKLVQAWSAGLRPILCVGEVLADRDAGRAEAVVEGQLRGALAGAPIPTPLHDAGTDLPWITIAYEPVWAIGTGRNARGSDAAAMAAAIRRTLDDLDIEGAAVPILYGGSVKASNAKEILRLEGVDGVLVGGASLKASDFLPIIEASPAF